MKPAEAHSKVAWKFWKLKVNTVKVGFKSILTTLLAAFACSAAIAQLQPWMSPEIGQAWRQGYQGQGVTITVVDDFSSGKRFSGRLDGYTRQLTHGVWTAYEAVLVAPRANLALQDFTSNSAVALAPKGLNVLNLSYGMFAPQGYSTISWAGRESLIINYAANGQAVISKAAGNDFGTAVGKPTADGRVDYLARDLIGKQSAIFVGALNKNGTPQSPATMASYSNIAGADSVVQKQFLVVGVEQDKTGLAGTSFAAPIISGYSAILGSKFSQATPTQITNQLLNTARQDTIAGYNPATHGRGEASLARALAPRTVR